LPPWRWPRCSRSGWRSGSRSITASCGGERALDAFARELELTPAQLAVADSRDRYHEMLAGQQRRFRPRDGDRPTFTSHER
jgi:hypothetical protein